MSTSTSPSTKRMYGLERVCRVWQVARSTVYSTRKRRKSNTPRGKRGPKTLLSDEDLLASIRQVIEESPFMGEGHRKVRARLRRNHNIRAGTTRVLRLMRRAKLLSPHRSAQGKAKTHDGRIVTDVPNDIWATDAVKIFTEEDGWVWYFGVTDQWNSENLGWVVTKRGDRYAVMDALREAVKTGCGSLCAG